MPSHPAAGDPPAPDPHLSEPEYPFWQRNMLAMAAASFVLSLSGGMTGPFLPLIFREVGVPGDLETWVGYALGGNFLIAFLLHPVWGVVADHYGRRLMVLRASLGMGLLYLAMAFAPSLWGLMTLFLLMGTTSGFIPATNALIATNTPQRYAGRSLGNVQLGSLVGATLGPAIGAVVAVALPRYQWLFLVSGVLILAAGAVALLFSQEVHSRPQGPFRLNLWRDLKVIARIPHIGVLFCMNFIYTYIYLGSVPVISVYTLQLLEAEGITEGAQVEFWIGAISLAMTIAAALAAPLWGRLLDHWGPHRTLLAGLGGSLLACLPIVVVQTPLQLAIARFVLGALLVGIYPAAISLTRAQAPRGMESRVLAYGTSLGALGIGGGPFVAGLVGPVLGLRAHFALNALVVLAVLLFWIRAMKNRP